MMKIVAALLSGVLLVAAPATSHAAQCRDNHGKFIKCAPTVVKPVQCRDPKTGRFVKCQPPVAPKGPCRDPKTGKFTKCH